MESRNNIDSILAEKLRQSRTPRPSKEMNGRIMVAIQQRARRRRALRRVCGVALGVVVGAILLALIGFLFVFGIQAFGLGGLFEWIDVYVEGALYTLRTIAQSSTFSLLAFVSLVLMAIITLTEWMRVRTERSPESDNWR